MGLILSLYENTARRTVRSERAAIIPIYFSSVLMASEMYADLIAHLRVALFLPEITRHAHVFLRNARTPHWCCTLGNLLNLGQIHST